MEKILIVVFIAVVLEGIVTHLKKAIPAIANNTGLLLLITSALGIAASITYSADIFALLGFDSQFPLVGEILTGILCGRGSNYMYDLIGWKSGSTKTDETNAETQDETTYEKQTAVNFDDLTGGNG